MSVRIAHVISTPSGVGGAELVLAALVERGRANGWEQLVLNPFAESATPELEGSLAETDFRVATGSRFADLLGTRKWVARELGRFGPNIVHAHLFHALLMVASLRPSSTIRLLTHHHGAFFRAQGRTRDELIDRRMGNRFDSVVAVSDFVRRFLIEDYGYPASKVVTIRNGWQGSPLPRSSTGAMERVVCVGNFRPEKGHSVLLSAFADVLKARPSASLILVGDGPLRGNLAAQSEGLGIERNVEFMGYQKEVWPHLSDADLCVFPSLSESLGIAVMEAMATGLPVIASRVGGIPEVVEDGVSGYLVPPGDPAPLARRIVEILSDQKRGTVMGRAGQSAVTSMTMDVTVDAYEDHYRTLSARASRR